MSIPDCQFLCPPRLHCNTPWGLTKHLLGPSILSLLLAAFGRSSQRVPRFNSGVQHQNELPWKNSSQPWICCRGTASRSQTWLTKAIYNLANVHLGRMVHHTSWKNIEEIVRKKQRSAKISLFCDVLFFSFEHDKLLKLTADFSPTWTHWGNPGGKSVLLPNSNYSQPGLKFEIWTLCQSLCDLLVRTIDLFLWNTVLSCHQPHFSLVPGNPASLAVHGHSNWKRESVGEKASKNPLHQ